MRTTRQPASLLSCSKAKMILPAMVGTLRRPESRMGNAWQADGHGQTGETAPRNIGRIVLADIEPGWKAEIWRIYIGDTALRGKGYGKEAMLAMMEYCFGQLGLERLYLDHYTGNPAAYLYLSLGFQYEGVLRKNCRKNGVLYDVHPVSMLREEYEERYGKRYER